MAVYDHSYDSVKIALSNYAKNLNPSLRNAYIDKLKHEENGNVLYFPDPYLISKENWLKDVTMWPKIEYPDLVNYLISSKGEYNSECLKNYKSLAAYDYVISGKVSDVYVFKPSGVLQNFLVLGADVQPSQRLRNEVLKPWVIAREEGTVQMAHCTCMAGFGETCSHVAAVLFKVELAVRNGETTTGVTESLCRWNNNFSNNVLSLPMAEINLKKRKWESEDKPRRINVLPRKRFPPLTPLEISKIKKAQPDAVFFTSFASDSSETDSPSDNEEVLLPTLEDLFKTYGILDRDKLKSHYNDQNCKSLEEATRSQSLLWQEHRVGRLTSSNFGPILKRKKWNDIFSKSILFPSEINVPAIRWGKCKEKNAIECYVESAKKNHVRFEYSAAGLHIDPNNPHLGASPDGKIKCECCGEGVLEVKCPYKHKEADPKLISAFDKTFCLNEDSQLKESHNYSYQVQGQMAICKVSYCDFVIWTKKGLLINRIYQNPQFMIDHKKYLDDIYDTICLPFLLKRWNL